MHKLIGNDCGKYTGEQFTLAREHGKTPNGNELNGRWVLRDAKGEWVDFDQYRHDLAARYDLELIGDA